MIFKQIPDKNHASNNWSILSMTLKKTALSMTLHDWVQWLSAKNEKSFRAKSLFKWLYVENQWNPLVMSDFPKNIREKLLEEFDFFTPQIDTLLSSSDGSDKILLKLSDNRLTECVLMPSENRVTLCVSSQVGCKMACTFCQTGKMGLMRNLTSGEILYQITLGNQRLRDRQIDRKITNIVFMGMGEPLDNFDHVVESCSVMIDPFYFGLSKHKVTVSTSGLIPEIEKLGAKVPVALAISLHNAFDEERSKIMPINKKYPLDELKQALLRYPIQTRHGITFEYVMLENVNDSMRHAKKLVQFLHGLKAKVNLIPMNPHPGSNLTSSHESQMKEFQKYLSDRSIPAPIRYSRGQDVSAACGQLALKRKDELELTPRSVAILRQRELRSSFAADH